MGVVRKLLRVLLPPGLRDPTPFVEEFAHNHHIVADDVLGHSYPVDSDVGCDVFPPFDRLLVDAPSWEMMRGTITAFQTFFSRVSCTFHVLYVSSFSLNALAISSDDVTLTSTTTFLH